MQNRQNAIRRKEAQLKEVENKGNKIYTQLKKMRRRINIQVTDHAMIRYLERCKGVDLEKLKTELLTIQAIKLFNQLGDGTYPIGEGTTRVVIKNSVVVTVIN